MKKGFHEMLVTARKNSKGLLGLKKQEESQTVNT